MDFIVFAKTFLDNGRLSKNVYAKTIKGMLVACMTAETFCFQEGGESRRLESRTSEARSTEA